MADSILRLRVDSSEHDNKLKKASESLQRYADGCRKAGGTLEYVDEGVADFVRSLGKMETSSNSLRGKIGELTKSFTDLSHQYNQMTEAEKNGDYGKALKASLDDIKVRIKDSKQELDNINSSINGGGGLTGALDSLAGKFGLNIGELTKFGSVAGVATTALKVAKDAFFQSEQNIDEWGRTLKGAESAYDVFLQTLNNGNWSQFFSNLETAIRGGRDLYDLFDRLGSVKANNSVAIAMTQAEIQQLRLLKQAGQDVDDKIKAATQRLAQLQGQSTQAGIAAGKGQVVNTLRNGVNSIGGARINDATLSYAADQIAKGGQAYFDYMKRRAAALEQKGMVTRTQTINDSQGGTYERQYRVFDINQLSKEQQKQYAIAKTVTERETEIQKGLSVWSQSVREQASNSREIFRDNRYSLQGSGGGGGGGGNIDTTGLESSIAAAWEKAMLKGALNTDALKAVEPEGPSEAFKAYFESIKQEAEGAENSIKSLEDAFKALNGKEGVTPIKEANKAAKDSQKEFQAAASAIQQAGSAMQSIVDPIAKVMGIVAQAIGSIALGFAQASAQEGKGGIWYWIAATAAGLATMVSTISAIHSATGYAQGGIVKAAGGTVVPGNNYSGDMVPAMLNSGELVLNRAQQGNLASQLEGGGMQNLQLSATIRGEDIKLALNNNSRRTGRGEYVTTNFR